MIISNYSASSTGINSLERGYENGIDLMKRREEKPDAFKLDCDYLTKLEEQTKYIKPEHSIEELMGDY